MPRGAAIGALTLLLSGCAVGDGLPHGEATVTLDAGYQPLAERDRGGGWQKLSSELHVRVTGMALQLVSVDLVDAPAVDASAFDPSSPPPGYSLCHNGHCHRDDGALVPYEEIAAEASGSTAAGSVVLSATATVVDVTSPGAAVLPCQPDCLLDEGRIGSVKLRASELSIVATLRDGLDPPRFAGEIELRTTLEVAALSALVDVPIGREHEPRFDVTARLRLTAAMFDGIDPLALADGDHLPVHQALLDGYGELDLAAIVHR